MTQQTGKLLALRSAGEGIPYVVQRLRRMLRGSWLAQYAVDLMMLPPAGMPLCLNAFGTVMLSAALMARVMVAYACQAAFSASYVALASWVA